MPPNVTDKKKISIGLLAALVTPELEAFEPPLEEAGWKKVKVSPDYRQANIETWQKEIEGTTVEIHTGVIGQMGQTSAAIETLVFLKHIEPSVIFLCGIAGSLDDEKYKKGDVIVANHVHWKGQNRKEDGDPCPIYRHVDHKAPAFHKDTVKSLEKTIARNQKRITNGKFQIHCGEIYSWDYVTSGIKTTEKILKLHNKAMCVEMEAGGFLTAVERYKNQGAKLITGLVVRGISDYTRQKDKDIAVRADASRNAARVSVMLAEDAFDPNGSNLVGEFFNF